MNIDFAFILIILTLITGIFALVDKIFFEKKRQPNQHMPWYFDYSRSLFPVFLIVLLLRSFVAEGFRIPSGSLKPTLLNGDFIVANKFSYGLRLPVTNTKILNIGEPKRGDIMIFHWPADPSKYDLIKRVIGLPGDHISYINKVLYINGKEMTQTLVGPGMDSDNQNNSWPVQVYRENLDGINHDIYRIPSQSSRDFKNIVVPPHMYFMMGDNRDNSEDSRYWGFVPEENIVGKAMWVVLSWDGSTDNIRWNRIGTVIH